jgi:hypothetical protein
MGAYYFKAGIPVLSNPMIQYIELRDPPEKRQPYCVGGKECHFAEGAVMIAFAIHLLECELQTFTRTLPENTGSGTMGKPLWRPMGLHIRKAPARPSTMPSIRGVARLRQSLFGPASNRL